MQMAIKSSLETAINLAWTNDTIKVPGVHGRLMVWMNGDQTMSFDLTINNNNQATTIRICIYQKEIKKTSARHLSF
jgi:hypothetical protein